jgi:hypothetical protein
MLRRIWRMVFQLAGFAFAAAMLIVLRFVRAMDDLRQERDALHQMNRGQRPLREGTSQSFRSGLLSEPVSIAINGKLQIGLCLLLWMGFLFGLPKIGHGNEAHVKLMAASEEVRRAAFQIIIGGAGESCDNVRRTFFQAEKASGEAIWNIECETGSYSVTVTPDGKTRLISCGQRMRLEGKRCFEPM